jgi:hypothetical protein
MREQVHQYGFNWVLLFRRRTNDVIENNKTNCQLSMVRGDREHGSKTACLKKETGLLWIN